MKRILLTLLAVMTFAGVSLAQDVYYSGYYNNASTGKKAAAVYKNGSKIHEYSYAGLDCESKAVRAIQNTVYWSVNVETSDNYKWADIYQNQSVWLDSPTNQYRYIEDMCLEDEVSNYPTNLYAAGSMIVDGLRRAVVWKGYTNDASCSSTPYRVLGNTSYGSEALACCYFDSHLWVAGIQYLSEIGDSYRGVLWRDGSEFCNFGAGIRPEGIDISSLNGDRIFLIASDANHDYDTYIIIEVWDLRNSNTGEFNTNIGGMPVDATQGCISMDDGILWFGQKAQSQLMVLEHYGVIYSHPISSNQNSQIASIEVNSNGAYYAGQLNGQGKVWKDGNVLYSPSSCACVKDLYIRAPSCGQSTYNLPFNEDFEYGSTHWPCWQADHNWEKDINIQGQTHSINAICHLPYGNEGENWFKSPQINIPSGGGSTTLTFDSKLNVIEGGGSYNGGGCRVYVSTSSVPNNNTFTDEIWVASEATNNWETITVDLSAYQGQSIYLGFSAIRPNVYSLYWYIDNISVNQSAPTQYTITVNANNNAWGTVSGGGQYNAGATCTLHATPASGYQFESWKKNGTVVSTNPNYSFTVTENATYTAYFSAEPVTYYTITTEVTPTGAGTVSGGGTFPAGSSITLTATANPGYTFSQWQDGNTSNPRTITVTGDATYTAQFTQDNYIITTNVTPPGAGTVTGGGAYHYGDNVTLTATPNANYEFAGWHDGNTDNPRSITVTGNETYTAVFGEVGTTYYNVTTSVSPAGAGTVTGGGTYEAGSVIVLTATANPGYTFNRWDDNSTQNPRTVTVNGDMSFTAIFTQNQYVITVVANPSNAGMVSGGGAYYYGNHATLTATAYSGYEFQGWSDGSTENPHQVLVTDNATYTATFSASGSTYYTVSAYVSPSGAGTVSGTGSFPAGSTTTLTATAYNGYTFDHWNDGVTSPSRTVTVNNNMSFTAYFTANQYTITVSANPSNGGTVTGGGTYTYGATAVLTATPNSGFEFLQWSDGNPNSTRYITVTQNATYTALFLQAGGTVYTLTVVANYPLLGQTFGSGTYPAGSSVEISAYPSEYAIFVQWSDGNTQNPRTVTVNSNATYTAEFRAAERYTVTVESANPSMGEAYGGGTFFEGAVTEISAIPNTGYVFTGWNDGNTQNPRTVTVTSNATYTANFTSSGVVTHTLTVMCNTAEGTVSGGGVYVHGATAVIQAFPNPGYTFTKWSDENTQNPRTITVNNDMSLAAFFATGFNETPLSNLKLYPNPATSTIRIAGLEANSSVMIYNSLGELVKVVNADADQEIDVRDLASGLYMVRCGNATLRFVKEQ